jgi:ADP-ribose pyrophosphatase YjhB (NUDIX family)
MHPARVFTGETVEDTVAREVKEETQGTVSNLRLLGVSGHAEARGMRRRSSILMAV